MKKTFFCIDAHTCGCPVRLVAGGGPLLEGNSMMERRLHFMKEYDWIRKGLMFEPRGHDMMSGSILYPPCDPANDIGVLYIETSGCLPMCGHGTIGTVTIAIEEGLVEPKTPGKLRLETPAGLVLIDYKQEGKRVKSVKLTNVKSFLYAEGLEVVCPDLGMIRVDVSFGGNFYGIIDPQENFEDINRFSASQLIYYGKVIRKLLNEKYQFIHPENSNISGLSHIQWTGSVLDPSSTGRNAVLVGENALDRSPCGTGTSARMAQWYAKGKLKKGDRFIHESYIGSKFLGTIEEEATINGKPAIIPGVEGWALITGYNHIIIDDEDPYAFGFQVI
ncbi:MULTISPECIES: 4-hydroxyproline epimerase [Olivibacter]|uniref:4-hydroxyproline epimerase n=1 Tax=Olivibacter jilunii TaxID=985016 RepID=A0ABW6B3G5_9SPHI|nr:MULTISPECIES: 4-hydroxyproline epimerase [unclassified Olivibacter]MDM8177925.1 4-hydroxyproline epimerase [Olivibacter sp. 47]MDX3916171.1 4-hydroxyproline epimerase [Pseudosphingobacterium sp.]QEK99609.1 4-hydroxyproline epimerase [Olivibacter sp. LS-1]